MALSSVEIFAVGISTVFLVLIILALASWLTSIILERFFPELLEEESHNASGRPVMSQSSSGGPAKETDIQSKNANGLEKEKVAAIFLAMLRGD